MAAIAIADDFEAIRQAMQHLEGERSPRTEVQDPSAACRDARATPWAADVARSLAREPRVWHGGAVYDSIEEFGRSGADAAPPPADPLHAAGF